jgi:hypothetical protein
MMTIEQLLQKLRDTFDPGGNLPEDCAEWAAEHERAIDELSTLVASQEAETPAPAETQGPEPLAIPEQDVDLARAIVAKYAPGEHGLTNCLVGVFGDIRSSASLARIAPPEQGTLPPDWEAPRQIDGRPSSPDTLTEAAEWLELLDDDGYRSSIKRARRNAIRLLRHLARSEETDAPPCSEAVPPEPPSASASDAQQRQAQIATMYEEAGRLDQRLKSAERITAEDLNVTVTSPSASAVPSQEQKCFICPVCSATVLAYVVSVDGTIWCSQCRKWRAVETPAQEPTS